ncbi:hypothetical protein [Romboutsia lituseburensis]|uniref:hypothetical protein n=1 Tax=Romboutsia lituseburensis TaxID=1537 RepID=UPI0022EA84A6|nr:hypothetical protein [Romboutsia lituseburensis]
MKSKNKAFFISGTINLILLIPALSLFKCNFIETNTKNLVIVGSFFIVCEIIKNKIIEKKYKL